jgi:hypothetical protein
MVLCGVTAGVAAKAIFMIARKTAAERTESFSIIVLSKWGQRYFI